MGKNDKTLTIFISSAVAILLMVALISSLATESQKVTSQTVVSREVIDISPARLVKGAINTTYPFTVANPPTGWKTETTDCNINGISYGNTTTTWSTTNYTLSTAGVLLLKDTTAVNQSGAGVNTTYLSYSYCDNNYLNSSWGRTLLNTNVGLIAVAILVVAVLLAYQLLGKKEDDD